MDIKCTEMRGYLDLINLPIQSPKQGSINKMTNDEKMSMVTGIFLVIFFVLMVAVAFNTGVTVGLVAKETKCPAHLIYKQ